MGSELGVTADSKSQVNLDNVGIWWICWACIWTVLLLCGMGYLIRNRHAQILRIRDIGLSLSAVVLLHLYWFSVQLAYVLGPLTPAESEYWIMGTYLPLGIALFHASNSRFLYVAQAQQKYLNRQSDKPMHTRRGVGLFGRFKNIDNTSRMIFLIGLGMGLQVSAGQPTYYSNGSCSLILEICSSFSRSSCTSFRASSTAVGAYQEQR